MVSLVSVIELNFRSSDKNPLENTFLRQHTKTGQTSPFLGFIKKNQVSCPLYFGLRNPKMVSDLKLDLVMMTSQRRPNVHLMGNPAVNQQLPSTKTYYSPLCTLVYVTNNKGNNAASIWNFTSINPVKDKVAKWIYAHFYTIDLNEFWCFQVLSQCQK